MRWFVLALCAGVLVGAFGCGPIAGAGPAMGFLVFQKDSASCADTTNTELFIDGVSQGQFTMRPGSATGFTESANTHLASATEVAGKLRQFPSQAVAVPAGGQGIYIMTCLNKPPPNPSPAGR